MIYTLCYLPKVYWIDEECLFAQVVQTMMKKGRKEKKSVEGGLSEQEKQTSAVFVASLLDVMEIMNRE